MTLLDFLFGRRGHDLDELARRLGLARAELDGTRPSYHEWSIPKRGGGARRIRSPDPELKRVQRRILRRLLALLVSHRAAIGFERGQSIVTHAARHRGRALVVRLDVRNFFEETAAGRVKRFFRRIGWNRAAAARITELCTCGGGLPQGAPTSPRLSNLVNFGLDVRLDHLAKRFGAVYTRYADDLTFSFDQDEGAAARRLVRLVAVILEEHGYRLNRRKQRIRRRHQQQRVAGLVVNERINLPRSTRRWLRAVEHRVARGRPATISEAQLHGWRALCSMIERQAVE